MTSFSAAAYIGRMTKVKKIGHTGTLDPGACGMLTLCLGKATKIADHIVSMEKTYISELKLGKTTDTLDSQGKVLDIRPYTYDRNKLLKILDSFLGTTMQMPPMFSAIKVNGKKLYELARHGMDIERNKREVRIDCITVEDDKDPAGIMLKIRCSKGTYIRSLMADIGDKYGCGAHMGFLLRTCNGSFDIKDAHTLEETVKACDDGTIEDLLTGIAYVFRDHEKIFLDDRHQTVFVNGAYIDPEDLGISCIPGRIYAVYNEKDDLLGLGETIMKGMKAYLKSKKLL
jgi:tRNA pseudouridine55 synthase